MGADYPSETFRVLKNSELRAFGEYRTQRLVLAAWDALEAEAAQSPTGRQYGNTSPFNDNQRTAT